MIAEMPIIISVQQNGSSPAANCQSSPVCQKFLSAMVAHRQIPEAEVATYAAEIGPPEFQDSWDEVFTALMDNCLFPQACATLRMQPTVKYISRPRCRQDHSTTACRQSFRKMFYEMATYHSEKFTSQDLINHVSRWGFATEQTQILSVCDDCENGIFAFDHDYPGYAVSAVQHQRFEHMRALVLTYYERISLSDLFTTVCRSASLQTVQRCHAVLIEMQSELPTPELPSLHLTSVLINPDSLAIMKWYYSVDPTAFTTGSMAAVTKCLQDPYSIIIRSLLRAQPELLAQYQRFFDEVTLAQDVLVKSAYKV